MRTLIVAALVLMLALTAPVRAQWVVFDPTNFAIAIEQAASLVQQYTQLVQTYQQIRAQYQHWVWMAQRLSPLALAKYRSTPNVWRAFVAPNTYHTLDAWLTAVNAGTNALFGYRQATQTLWDYGGAGSRMPADAWARAKMRYGQVELFDASAAQGLDVIGQLRLRAPDILRATKALEDDSLSTADDFNTLIAVLNKINAAGVLSIRTAQNANQLLVSLLESQLADATRRRDAEVAAINASIIFEQEARRFAGRFTDGTTSAILGFSLP